MVCEALRSLQYLWGWQKGEAQISEDDTSGKKNLLLLIQLRWLAVGGQIATIFLVHFWLDVTLPLWPMAAVILFLVGLNAGSLYLYRARRAASNNEIFFQILFDVAALTLQLYLTGGASNPFISLYLLQVTLGAVLLETRTTWLLVIISSGCFISLTFFFREISLPHNHGTDFFNLHIQGMFICFVLAAILLVVFITRISRNLRARDARLADLRRQAVEEEHIVRMGLLASGAAHELGTPLSTLSVILNDWHRAGVGGSNPETTRDLQEMENQLARCKSIVSNILMSSGEARGEGTVRITVRTFLDELVEEWKLTRGVTALSYKNVFYPDETIILDIALKQVLVNVFDNALEVSRDWVGTEIKREGDSIVISVTDHGPGFSEEILSQFGRPYRSTKSKSGSGLGLFLVANVLRKLGGRIQAVNADGRGAIVTMVLPLASLRPGE
jgi:two-component system sensor histidine kinase RegB